MPQFAEALYEFSHSAGWMLSLQRRLDKAAARMIPARDTDRLVAKLATDIEQAWREVQAAQEAVRAAAVAPPIPIAGLEPAVWLHGVMCAVAELVELTGGRSAAGARLGLSTEQDARCDELRRGLEARIRELREMSSVPARDLTSSAMIAAADTSQDEVAPQCVTLDQAAAIVNRTKRTLEKYLDRMPAPFIRGGGGKPSLWRWDDIRPWLEKQFVPDLPRRFPRNIR
jgi:hypothetical protein